MKQIALLFFVAAMVTIAGCNPKADTGKDMALADSLLKVNVNAYNSGDVQKIVNLFADDALMIVNGKNTWGRDSITAFLKPIAPIIKNFKAYLGPYTVKENLIQLQKYFTADIVAGDKTLKGKGLAILVYEKQADNSWKIVLEYENYDIRTY